MSGLTPSKMILMLMPPVTALTLLFVDALCSCSMARSSGSKRSPGTAPTRLAAVSASLMASDDALIASAAVRLIVGLSNMVL